MMERRQAEGKKSCGQNNKQILKNLNLEFTTVIFYLIIIKVNNHFS